MAQEHLPAEARKEQIVNATLKLVAQYGVEGTTVARIAERVGVTVAAIYAHYSGKRELLLATLELVFKRIRAIHQSSSHSNALDRLREIGERHTAMIASKEDDLVAALFELIAAPPGLNLREVLGARHLELIHDYAEIVREGQRQGSIVAEADPEQIAWVMVSRHWTEDIAQLSGISSRWDQLRSMRMLDLILGSIAQPGAEAQPAR